MIDRDVRRAAAHYAFTIEQEEFFVEEAEGQLVTTLFFVNGAILLITGTLSYFLAGRTLSPIKKTLLEQRQFLSDASHELRTPLAVLKTNMEVSLADKSHLSKAEEKNIHSNLEEVDHMAKLVNDLLLLSRLDNKTNKVRVESISLSKVVETSVERLQKYAKSKSVAMSVTSPKNENFTIKGNEEAFSSAFSNILKNAIDYNVRDGSVIVTLRKTDGSARVDIADTGIGIPKDQLESVFRRFYRGEKSRTGKVNGTGLGLSIARAIIEDHGGTISIESKVDKGTKVSVLIPLI